jgi:hypothetical protein
MGWFFAASRPGVFLLFGKSPPGFRPGGRVTFFGSAPKKLTKENAV